MANISGKRATIMAPSAVLGLSCLIINYAINKVSNTETSETNIPLKSN